MKAVCAVSFPKVCSYLRHAASQRSLKTGCHLGQVWQSHPVWFNLTDTVYPTGMESALTTHYAYLYVHRFDKKKFLCILKYVGYAVHVFVISFEKAGFPKLNIKSWYLPSFVSQLKQFSVYLVMKS